MWCRHRSGTTRISARSTSGVTTSRPPRSTETFSSTDGRRSSSTISCRPTRGRHACSRSAATRRLFRPAARGSGQDSGGLHPHLPREDQQLRHRLRPLDCSPVTLSDKTEPPPIFRSSSDSPTPNVSPHQASYRHDPPSLAHRACPVVDPPAPGGQHIFLHLPSQSQRSRPPVTTDSERATSGRSVCL